MKYQQQTGGPVLFQHLMTYQSRELIHCLTDYQCGEGGQDFGLPSELWKVEETANA